MKLLIITSPNEVAYELETINELFAMGLEILHLRKPGYGVEQMEGILAGIELRYYPRIMVHSHHPLRYRYGLRGCHFPAMRRGELDSAELPEHCSTSCHSIAELKVLRPDFDYSFISPVFDSISKPGYHTGIDRNELAGSLDEVQTRVVALGGVDGRTLPLLQKGCWGAAFLGAIWGENEMSRRLASFEQLMEIAEKP